MAVGDGRRHSPSPSRPSALIHLKVASRSAPAGTPRLRTGSYTGQAGDLRERFPRVRIRLRGDSHYACPEVMNWCEARGIEYIFGLAGTAPLTARVQTLEARTGARYAARRAAEPPGFKLRRYMDFRGKSWKCERRIGSKPDPTGSTPANRHEPDRPPGAAALRAEILPERENLLKSFTWPPIGPPAREPAPINLSAWGRLLVAVDVPEPHAEALALAPVRHPPEQADQARHRGHRNGRSHSNCSGPGVPGRGYPHRRLGAPRSVRHLTAGRCARTQESVPATPNPTPHLSIKTRPHGHRKTYN